MASVYNYNDFGFTNTCVAISSFDGVHKEHHALMDNLRGYKSNGCKTAALVLGTSGKRLTTADETTVLLSALEPDAIVFGFETADTAVAAVKERGARLVQGGSGQDMSTQISKLLRAGDVPAANELLGRPYTISGKIVRGKAIGRKVGMPTANLSVAAEKLLPMEGVYATAILVDGCTYRGITNIGRRPTIDNLPDITVEAHILDFNRDIYGMDAVLALYGFIRGVRRFDSIESVKAQVDRDIEIAGNILCGKI